MVMAALDRFNIGYAQLQMKQDLDFSDLLYGIGASLFFVAYFIFEVPSNLLMERVGARKIFVRIMFCWGLASSATMFVTTPAQFYFVRFLLGFFEAGFMPGVMLYFTYWYPNSQRGRIAGYFLSAVIVAGIVGGPVSGYILSAMNGVAGLKGWQWMFLLEGLPSSFLGIAAWFFLVDKPAQAAWLTDAEKAVVAGNISADRKVRTGIAHERLSQVFLDPRVWLLAFVYFTLLSVGYALNFWLPSLIKNLGVSDIGKIGLLSAIPYMAGLVAMLWYGRHSDNSAERRWHYCVAVCGAAVALVLSTMVQNELVPAMILLTLTGAFISGALPVFWAIPPAYLSENGAAAGLALVTCVGQLGGIFAGAVTGWIIDTTGSAAYSIRAMAILLVMAGVLMVAGLPARLLHERKSVPMQAFR